MDSDAHSKLIATRLREFDRSHRNVRLLRGLAESALIYATGLLLIILLEWCFPTRHGLRLALSGTNLFVAGAWCIHRAGLAWLRRASLRNIATAFENASGGRHQERILSAVEMSQPAEKASHSPGISPWMVEQTIRVASEEIQCVNPAALVDRKPMQSAWKFAGGLVLLICVGCLIPQFRDRLLLAMSPKAGTDILSHIRLAVLPGNLRVRQGTPVEIKASVNEPVPAAAVILRWDDGLQETVPMARAESNSFNFILPAVSQGFHYHVVAADAESLRFAVKVDVPPRISRMELLIEPPAYARRTNSVIDGGSADFLTGSRVLLTVETAGDAIQSAEWLPEGEPARGFRIEGNRLRLQLAPTNPVTYQVRLTGRSQLTNESNQKWQLRVLPDNPPMARLQAFGLNTRTVEPREVLRFETEAADDLGLKRVDLIVLNRESQSDARTIYEAPGGTGTAERQIKHSLNYDLAELGSVQGDEVQFQLIATDLKDQVSRSDPVNILIGSQQRMLQAEAAKRMKQLLSGIDGQIDQLQQTKASWLSLSRNYRLDERGPQQPAVALLRSRLNEFGREVGAIGGTLVAESETNNLPDARFMYRLGTTISNWADLQKTVLLANSFRFETGATNEVDIFDRGRELFTRALTDLEEYRRVVALLGGALETEALASDTEAAQGRYKRALPVLRGDAQPPEVLNQNGPGLLATFLEGVELKGKILEQKIARPKVESNYSPANIHDNWSARFEGDINLSQDGEWTIGCIADDGVRLFVDGKPLLPAGAWKAQAATEYKANSRFKAGWHPIIVEYFQTSSEAKLQLMAARKDQPWQEVPADWLRPPSARQPHSAPSPALAPLVKESVNRRVQSSLARPAGVPPLIAPMTNFVHNENLTRLTREKLPVGESLASNLLAFTNWKPEDNRKSEAQADDLTGFARTAQRIVREELEKFRWRYEGAEALKKIQIAIDELRELNQELWRLPHNPSKERTPQEQMKIDLAKVWEKQLEKAAKDVAHDFFETAKQKDATLAERTMAMLAAAKVEADLSPAIEKLGETLAKDSRREEMAPQMDQRLNDVANRYRELDDMQERINREHVAAEARRALPAARDFARAQSVNDSPSLPAKHEAMKKAVARVESAQRVMGDYQGAQKLDQLSGDSPESAKGKETASELRGLAAQTDNNPPSLAQSIPPPMQKQTEALAKDQTKSEAAANQLSQPRLAMALEAARLYRQRDPRTAVAYDFLGQDLGAVLQQPANVTADEVRPLAERAAALAGQKGEEARQAEIRAAGERLKQLAHGEPADAQALAARLDELSAEAMQAAGNAARQGPLRQELGQVAALAPATPSWAESSDPREVAASAASEAEHGIDAAPKAWESYQQASEILGDAARQIRMDSAVAQVDDLSAYPRAQADAAELAQQNSLSNQERPSPLSGAAGKALTQAPPPGLDQAEWARLNERLRKAILSSGIEHFSEEQQAAIRAYFERLSSEKAE